MMIMINNAASTAAAPAASTAPEQQHNPSTVANLQVVSVPPPSTSLSAPSNPRKKRTKLIRIENPLAVVVKRKPDPDAPKITRPCSECGRKFWSWKALFGHMRCHPERQWRGINPPPNFRNRLPGPKYEEGTVMTEDDHEVAACLLMLANSPIPRSRSSPAETNILCPVPIQTVTIAEDDFGEDHNCRFECSCCRKVFTSHQALGGHRASHRNVKGCFAIANPDGDFNDGADLIIGGGGSSSDNSHHKCGICARVFSSGQALGGHKRCHWEKTINNELPLTSSSIAPLPLLSSIYHQQQPAGGVDLNSPSVCEDCHHGFISGSNSYYTNCSHSSSPALDLRLGL